MAYPKNHDDDSDYNQASGELKQIIEQVETLESEEADVRERKKEIYSEAKARGYDTKILKQVVRRRKKDREDLEAEQALLETYESALLV